MQYPVSRDVHYNGWDVLIIFCLLVNVREHLWFLQALTLLPERASRTFSLVMSSVSTNPQRRMIAEPTKIPVLDRVRAMSAQTTCLVAARTATAASGLARTAQWPCL